ncbi:hypothetical protein C8J56DRAFT_854503 [Mycena floridula]|nr:hypothetical protein C8J56DRAFT_854503 [Mycena floridula]
MTKHSKNNTASSIFSYAEYKKLDYGTKRQRLGNESMRRFDACALCLDKAREPVACQQDGHLFCKECVYTDLLQQKNDIKRQKAKLETLKREAEEDRERAKEAARERVLLDFERNQGLGGAASGSKSISTSGAGEPRGTKRKFSLETAAEQIAEAEETALREIEREQAEKLRAKLPDFWLPSLTPTYAGGKQIPESFKDIKLQTTCRGGNPAHPIAMKNLIPVKFTLYTSDTPGEDKDVAKPVCPSCKKALSNNLLMFLMKPCGHVICKTCTDTLVRPEKQCVACDTKVGDDIIELKREGTGFAGGGMAESSKAGIAFQG